MVNRDAKLSGLCYYPNNIINKKMVVNNVSLKRNLQTLMIIDEFLFISKLSICSESNRLISYPSVSLQV